MTSTQAWETSRGKRSRLITQPKVSPKVSQMFVQVFVANPNKTQAIIDILAGNKEKLLRYLKDFHNDTSACLKLSGPFCPASFTSLDWN